MEQRFTRRTLMTGAAAMLLTPARARDGSLRAAPGGFDGAVPGPALRVKRGEEVRVRLINDLPIGVTLHWHGVRLPNAMDGIPPLTQKPVAAGESFDYRFTPPDAGTFWYRVPFGSAETRGLHGALIVDEAEPVDVDRDLAMVLSASSLPDIAVAANERVRLRLINAADRFMTLRIDRHPVSVMAIDGQPAEPFRAREGRITLAPGNRADLFVDAMLEPGSIAPIVAQSDGPDAPLTRLVYGAVPARAAVRPEPKPLPANPLPARMDFRGALRVDLDVSAASESIPAKPLFAVKRGRTVQLAIRNGGVPAALHIHGHHVRLLDALDDGWKPFWLDTVLSMPQTVTRVAFVADNAGKWLLHGRAIGADTQSLAWFEVA
jgi:FtsP/CotA-like multicopper oxidase with cupredoxin domain